MHIKTPDLGVEKAEVSEILVKVGDTVKKDQSLLVVESAKASVEVPSPADGVIQAVLVTVGQTIKEGVSLFTLEADEAAAPAPTVDVAAPAPAPAPASTPVTVAPAVSGSQTVSIPDLGVEQADVSEILVKVGDTVTVGQSLAVVESAKASVEIPSPYAGVVDSIAAAVGQTIKQGDALLVVKGEGQAQPAQQTPPKATLAVPASEAETPAPEPANSQPAAVPAPVAASTTTASAADVYAGPAVRKTARQLGVDLHQVSASGPHGRVLKEDVFAYVKGRLTAPSASAPQAAAASFVSGLPSLPDQSKWGAAHDEALTRLQAVSIPQLSLNLYLPQVTQFDHADITDVEALRVELKDSYKKQGISLTILAFIAKAVAHLLKSETRFNSHLNDDGKSLKVREEIHLGIAVATDDGLIVPVLRNPDRMGIREIAVALAELGQKARDKKLTPNDLAGATFTISSLGAVGGTGFTPLVNWPQVAILGISPSAMQPVWDGAAFQPRLMLPLSLSYDHRVINGVDAARFARSLAILLGDLRRVLL